MLKQAASPDKHGFRSLAANTLCSSVQGRGSGCQARTHLKAAEERSFLPCSPCERTMSTTLCSCSLQQVMHCIEQTNSIHPALLLFQLCLDCALLTW